MMGLASDGLYQIKVGLLRVYCIVCTTQRTGTAGHVYCIVCTT